MTACLTITQPNGARRFTHGGMVAAERSDLLKPGVLDLQFVPASDAANWDAFETDLKSAGYSTRRYADSRTLEASVGPILLDAEIVWGHEEHATRMAIARGFRPDGWGFLSDP